MLEQEELIASTRRDYENLTKEMTKIQVDLLAQTIYSLIFVFNHLISIFRIYLLYTKTTLFRLDIIKILP